jgi:hypothetical protein
MSRIIGMESLVWRWRCTSLPHGAWAGLASSAVRGEEDRELTFKVGDGVMGSGTVMGVGDGDRDTIGGVEAESGVGDDNGSRGTKGVGIDGATSREATA